MDNNNVNFVDWVLDDMRRYVGAEVRVTPQPTEEDEHPPITLGEVTMEIPITPDGTVDYTVPGRIDVEDTPNDALAQAISDTANHNHITGRELEEGLEALAYQQIEALKKYQEEQMRVLQPLPIQTEEVTIAKFLPLRIRSYTTAQSMNSIVELDEAIRNSILEGWELYGNMQALKLDNGDVRYFQQLVKFELR